MRRQDSACACLSHHLIHPHSPLPLDYRRPPRPSVCGQHHHLSCFYPYNTTTTTTTTAAAAAAAAALDTATEAAVTDAIKNLRGSTTVITVAHRLSTVQHSDRIYFMSGGRIAAQGTFAELVREVPEFAIQARLAGLGGTGEFL